MDRTPAPRLAAILQRARESMPMTQEHLAVASGLSVQTVRRAEQTGAVSAESVRALCSVLGLDAAETLERGRRADAMPARIELPADRELALDHGRERRRLVDVVSLALCVPMAFLGTIGLMSLVFLPETHLWFASTRQFRFDPDVTRERLADNAFPVAVCVSLLAAIAVRAAGIDDPWFPFPPSLWSHTTRILSLAPAVVFIALGVVTWRGQDSAWARDRVARCSPVSRASTCSGGAAAWGGAMPSRADTFQPGPNSTGRRASTRASVAACRHDLTSSLRERRGFPLALYAALRNSGRPSPASRLGFSERGFHWW